VTKKEIVKQISDRIGLTQLKTKDIVQQTFNAIVETLITERRIELRNFGVFEVKERKPRKARNPRTGEKVDVPSKFVVTFKPGKMMEEKVRQLQDARDAQKAAARAADVPDREDEEAATLDGHDEEAAEEEPREPVGASGKAGRGRQPRQGEQGFLTA
jgi:nucleoid DNA-binding protein